MLSGVQDDLERDFSPRHRAWVKGESGEQRWIAIDNALYVLYTLSKAPIELDRILGDARLAIKQLTSRLQRAGATQMGLPLFTDSPEVGPTSQLLEILTLGQFDLGDLAQSVDLDALLRFVRGGLAAPKTMPVTFSWHLSSALRLPALRDCALDSA